MMRKNVSVIIPSYNRAHLLRQIIPGYFQDEVLEVIVINDCSKDNTREVLCELQQLHSNLVVLENESNKKQMFSKNRGIDIAKGEFIFFGDDDSYLQPGAIRRMLDTKKRTGADVVGARILYMKNNESEFEQCIERHRKEGKFVSNLSKLEFSFTADLDEPVECFYAQALILVERSTIGSIRFDTSYTGNCYREETDFMLALYLKKFKFVYDSQALLINLPPQKATGGARTANKLKYHYESVVNNNRFLKKYNNAINEITNDRQLIFNRQLYFIFYKIISFTRKLLK
ncbi:glycosyltransferase family 2 protein [Citrobacter braakii]|uniref:glycosyltransferase family 2 protein n=1 Tax=Citrobacter braakii TaxID=57706 RepID=UPI0005432238|nr:glycosyltransferase [Citrobacter braakii]EGT0623189.1 glycosyltransferase [Citrobacter braakii]EGT0646889.1 glycosyltransferase [Citrobacter braakii]EGT0678983.1 glycosyltransferase [Citrobacter braakii]KHE05242.1 glycosyl transferase family A [Citrobacter braakii]MBJ8848332.1 glycosyltransferase [Citrobacter braakii]